MIREMRLEDYDQVYALWMSVKGFAMRSVDDSREGVARFLKRNPTTSVVAVEDGEVVRSSVVMTAGGAVCIMYVYPTGGADAGSVRRWWYLPWKR